MTNKTLTMDSLQNIRRDLTQALEHLDIRGYILESTMAHLEESCTTEEVKIVEDSIFDLDQEVYLDRERFMEDYQPIFDLVDFPFSECFRFMDARQLKYDNL